MDTIQNPKTPSPRAKIQTTNKNSCWSFHYSYQSPNRVYTSSSSVPMNVSAGDDEITQLKIINVFLSFFWITVICQIRDALLFCQLIQLVKIFQTHLQVERVQRKICQLLTHIRLLRSKRLWLAFIRLPAYPVVNLRLLHKIKLDQVHLECRTQLRTS